MADAQVDIVIRLDEYKSYSSEEAKLLTEAKNEILTLRSENRQLREAGLWAADKVTRASNVLKQMMAVKE